MIHEEQELDGSVFGQVLCGNPACRRVLRTYEGSQNAPGPDDHGYELLSVQRQILFTDSYGRPLRTMPSRLPCQLLGVTAIVNLDDRVVGYDIVPGSGVFLEDFCSDRCAVELLKNRQKWSLCFRRQQDGSVVFVAHIPERFTTETRQLRRHESWQTS